MKNTGQILREAREKKGISIAEVSLATKINSKILTAIEQGNLSKLPPKTFLRGFVLSYASFLQLDADHIIKTFQEEMGTTRPAAEVPDKTLTSGAATERSAGRIKSSQSGSLAKVGAIVGIIVLVFVIILLKKKMDSYESESVTKPTETAVASPTPAENLPPPDHVAASDDSGSPESALNSAAAISAASAPSATVTSTPAAAVTSSLAPSPASTPTSKPTETPVPSPTPTPAPKPSPTPKPSPSATPKPVNRVQDVTLEALNGVDVEAVIDGETQKFHLNADQVQTIKAKRKVSLKLSDGGAVSIIVNGIDRGVPGDLGKPKKVDIP